MLVQEIEECTGVLFPSTISQILPHVVLTRQHMRHQGSNVALRSERHPILTDTDVYVVDTLGAYLLQRSLKRGFRTCKYVMKVAAFLLMILPERN